MPGTPTRFYHAVEHSEETIVRHRRFIAALVASIAASSLCSSHVTAADADAAQKLARQSNCFRCHAIDKKKDGPAWHDVAVEFKGKPDAEQRLITHITSGEKAKFPDGHEEDHPIVKSKDPAQIKNLIDWILSH
jgi:cytochrome c